MVHCKYCPHHKNQCMSGQHSRVHTSPESEVHFKGGYAFHKNQSACQHCHYKKPNISPNRISREYYITSGFWNCEHFVLGHVTDDDGSSKEQSRTPTITKRSKQFNCCGQKRGNGSPTICNNFDSIICDYQDIYPVLPNQKVRSGDNKQYSPRKVQHYFLLMDSIFLIMLMFNLDLLKGIVTLNTPTGIHAGGNSFQTNQLGLLTTALQHLPFPKNGYNFHQGTVENLLSMAVVSYNHWVVMVTEIDNDIYMFNDNTPILDSTQQN